MPKLNCPTCSETVPSDNVELSLLIANCPSCDEVFSFAEQVGHHSDTAVARSLAGPLPDTSPTPDQLALAAHKQVVGPGASKVRESSDSDGLRLVLPWFGPMYIFLCFFALLWNGFMFVWFSIALSAGEVTMLAFGSIHGAVGVGVAYMALTGILNSTTLQIASGHITITHGPLPWPGGRDVPTDDIDQLFISRRVIKGKNSSRTVWDLMSRLHSGEELKLISAIEDKKSARFLESRAEHWLGIDDRHVPGEDL